MNDHRPGGRLPARTTRLVVLAEDDGHVRVRGDVALLHGAGGQAQGLGDLGGVLLVRGVGVQHLGGALRVRRRAGVQEGEAAVEEHHARVLRVGLGAAGVLHGDADGGVLVGALRGAAEDVLDHAGAVLGAECAVGLDGQQGGLVVAALGEVGELGEEGAEVLVGERGVEDLGQGLHGDRGGLRVGGDLAQDALHDLPEPLQLGVLCLAGGAVGGVGDGHLAAEGLVLALVDEGGLALLGLRVGHIGVGVDLDVADQVDEVLEVGGVQPPGALDVGAEDGVQAFACAVGAVVVDGLGEGRRGAVVGGEDEGVGEQDGGGPLGGGVVDEERGGGAAAGRVVQMDDDHVPLLCAAGGRGRPGAGVGGRREAGQLSGVPE